MREGRCLPDEEKVRGYENKVSSWIRGENPSAVPEESGEKVFFLQARELNPLKPELNDEFSFS